MKSAYVYAYHDRTHHFFIQAFFFLCSFHSLISPAFHIFVFLHKNTCIHIYNMSGASYVIYIMNWYDSSASCSVEFCIQLASFSTTPLLKMPFSSGLLFLYFLYPPSHYFPSSSNWTNGSPQECLHVILEEVTLQATTLSIYWSKHETAEHPPTPILQYFRGKLIFFLGMWTVFYASTV